MILKNRGICLTGKRKTMLTTQKQFFYTSNFLLKPEG